MNVYISNIHQELAELRRREGQAHEDHDSESDAAVQMILADRIKNWMMH